MTEQVKLEEYSVAQLNNICGNHDENFKMIEDALKVEISLRGDELSLTGKDSESFEEAKKVIFALLKLVSKGINISRRDVIYALKLVKEDKLNRIDLKIKEVAKYLEIEKVLDKYPYQMSGGQKQRVASARAIVTEPSLILADEPTGALDSKSARLLLERLESLNEELSATILMVTHDAFTASYAHRILFIKDGKIFTELVRGNDSRKEFFNRIMEVITMLGGDDNNVF